MDTVVVKRVLALVTTVSLTAGYGLYRYREQQMDRLYAEAAEILPAFHGTTEAQAAVRKLSTYKGTRSTEMLLNVALGRTPFTWPDVQREAINALAARREARIATALAKILQPHYPLPARQAVAEALRALPCTEECVKSILHYLERVSQGEPNYEDRTSFPAGLNESVKTDLAKQQQGLYHALYDVLKHDGTLTLDALVQIYGLGTDAPSKFSLALVSRMQFREACPLVLRSEQVAKQSSADSFLAPREELESTLRSLKCQ
jgi:hypothetical protein